MIRLLVVASALLLVAGGAYAEDKATIASLLKDGYEIKGVIPSNAGPGILLQKGSDAVMCFVAETQGSADIATQYCKPVH